MNFPIAERELRVASRSPRTYRGRFISAFIFGAMTAWMLWALTHLRMPSWMVAPQVFSMMTFAATLICLFNINNTADSISAEKRSGTLGLLFLTDLKGRDIVVGKLAAFGIATFYALMGTLPMIFIPYLLGGIEAINLLKTAITLLNTLFFALSAGLWVSAKSWHQKRAMNAAVWIALIFAWGIPGLSALLFAKYRLIKTAGILVLFSPFYQQQHANPFGTGLMLDHYWISLGLVHALAWLALWRACSILPQAWQDRPVSSETGRWRARWRDWKFGSGEVRKSFRTRLLNRNAVHWLSSVEMRAPWWVWLFIGLVLMGWVATWAWFNFVIRETVALWNIGIAAVIILQLGMWLRAAAVASEVLARDRFSGALELLLSTSLSVREVALGQMLTARRQLLGPVIFIFLLGIAVFLMGYPEAIHPEDRANCWMTFIGLNVLFFAELVSAFWTGLWAACSTRVANGSVALVMLRLLILPLVVYMLVITVCAVFNIHNLENFRVWFLGWFLITFVNAVAWAIHSHGLFYERLRLAAAERYQPPAPESWWKFWTWKERAS
jgi:ABC-type Na+ efflux pump permease subunit